MILFWLIGGILIAYLIAAARAGKSDRSFRSVDRSEDETRDRYSHKVQSALDSANNHTVKPSRHAR